MVSFDEHFQKKENIRERKKGKEKKMYESIIKSNMLNIMWGGGQGVESQVSKK